MAGETENRLRVSRQFLPSDSPTRAPLSLSVLKYRHPDNSSSLFSILGSSSESSLVSGTAKAPCLPQVHRPLTDADTGDSRAGHRPNPRCFQMLHAVYRQLRPTRPPCALEDTILSIRLVLREGRSSSGTSRRTWEQQEVPMVSAGKRCPTNRLEHVKGYQDAKELNLHSTILFPICATLSDTGKVMLWKTFQGLAWREYLT